MRGRYLDAFGKHLPCQQVEARPAVRCVCAATVFFPQQLRKGFADGIFSMHDKDQFWIFLKMPQPVQQPLLVGMSADPCKLLNMCFDADGFAKKPYFRHALYDIAPQCPQSLIANEQNGRFRPPEVMLQMVADTPCFAHARCRNDDLRVFVKIDCL